MEGDVNERARAFERRLGGWLHLAIGCSKLADDLVGEGKHRLYSYLRQRMKKLIEYSVDDDLHNWVDKQESKWNANSTSDEYKQNQINTKRASLCKTRMAKVSLSLSLSLFLWKRKIKSKGTCFFCSFPPSYGRTLFARNYSHWWPRVAHLWCGIKISSPSCR